MPGSSAQWFALRDMLPSMLFAAALSAVAAAVGIFVIAEIGRSISASAPRMGFWSAALLLLGLLVLNTSARYLLSTLAQDATLRIRRDLITRFMGASVRRIEEIGPPRVYSALTVDAYQVAHALASIPIALFSTLLLLCGIGYVAYLSWKLVLFVLGVAGIGVAVSVVFQRRAARILNDERHTQDSLIEAYEALAYGKKEFMLSERRRSRFLHRDMESLLETIRRAVVRSDLHWEISGQWTEIFLLLLLVMMVSLPSALLGLDKAVLAQTLLVTFYLRGPVGSLINVMQRFTYARVALRRLDELVLDDDTTPQTPVPVAESIELRGVGFSYRDERARPLFSVGPIDLVVRRGEVTFITGGNGSGKSTLCKLICGLYAPESGQLLADGNPVASALHLRERFAALFFDYFPFPTLPLSVEHLTPGRRAAIETLLADFGLDGKTALQGNRWSQTRLSTGQRRRLALISTLAEDKDIYLFDEPAADQDPHFRRFLYTQVIPALKRENKAVIVVSHDEAFFATADHLYVLSDGQFRRSREDVASPVAEGDRWQIPAALAIDPAEGAASPSTTEEPSLPTLLRGRPGSRRVATVLAMGLVLLAAAIPNLGTRGVESTDDVAVGRAAQRYLATWLGEQQPHPTGSLRNDAMADRLENDLRLAGFSVENQRATDCDTRQCVSLRNIIASRLPDSSRPALVISAHYDSAPAGPGAADNGLGVAAVMAFAQSSFVRENVTQNLILLFTDAEEQGARGAKAFVNQHPLANRAGYVVNLDSLGAAGPLVAYDLGAIPATTFAVALKSAAGLSYSGAIGALYRLMPNTTDLSVYSRAGIAGVSLGHVVGDGGYHLSGDRLERLDEAQFTRLAAVLRASAHTYWNSAPLPAGLPAVIGARVAGIHLWMPVAVMWGLLLVAIAVIAFTARRWQPHQLAALGLRTLWTLGVVSVALVAGAAFDAAAQALGISAPVIRMGWPIVSAVALAAALRFAGQSEYATPANACVLSLVALLLSWFAPGLALPVVTGTVFFVLAWRYLPQYPLVAPALAFVASWPLLQDAIVQVAGVSRLPAPGLGAALWLVVWLPWSGSGRVAMPATRGFAMLGALAAAVAVQFFAVSQLDSRDTPTYNTDRIVRRDSNQAYESVRGDSATIPDGFERRDAALFPWSGESSQVFRRVECCGAIERLGQFEVRSRTLRLTLASHRGANSLTIAVPSPAQLRAIVLDDGQRIDATGLIKTGGYQLFVLRDGLDVRRTLTLEFVGAAALPEDVYVAVESYVDTAATRPSGFTSSHLPDRVLVVDTVATGFLPLPGTAP
ncbi:cyclic peptide export ABC transporter [Tahibacter amnicola]|uniref:Cyclic peptide export ABC transporter n=1 Tax=Tahibacter amnicola TaxID=2976241 RepID=A0ABY6B911_9GAMM|nr:cyclic peptide export ABC transporter [Tahibacter amnicola]UXI66272.1 cyclic peptide export ABC transporter [Tahibacter amnicola]